MSLINDALKEARHQSPQAGSGMAGRPGPGYRPPAADGKRGVLIGIGVVVAVFCLLLAATVVLVLRLYREVRRAPGLQVATEVVSAPASAAVPAGGPGAAPVGSVAPPAVVSLSPPDVAPSSTPVPLVPPAVAPVPVPHVDGVVVARLDAPPVAAALVASPSAGAAGTAVEVAPSGVRPPDVPSVAVAIVPRGSESVTPPGAPVPASAEIHRLYPLKGIMKGRRGNTALIGSKIVAAGDRLSDGGEVVAVAEAHVVVRHAGVDYLLLQP